MKILSEIEIQSQQFYDHHGQPFELQRLYCNAKISSQISLPDAYGPAPAGPFHVMQRSCAREVSRGPVANAPLVLCAYENDPPLKPFKIKAYQDALEIRPDNGLIRAKKNQSGGGLRGDIKGLTAHTAGRLRIACMTLYKPLWKPYALSLTTHKKLSIEEYKKCFKRFSRVLNQAGIPAIFRHEMQKRGTPHCHMIVWLDPECLSLIHI